MAQTALSRASTCFTFTPLMNNRKAAPLKESTSAWCVAQCSGSQPTWCLGATVSACVVKNELPANPNLPGSMSHQCLGCQQPGRWQIAEQLCMHDVSEDTSSLHRFQTRFWLEWEATFRFIILFPPSYQKSQTALSQPAGKCGGQKTHGSAAVLRGGGASCSASLRVSRSLV